MHLEGKFALDFSNFKYATVKRQGEKSTSGSIFVPREWVDKKVLVILIDEGVIEVDTSENSDNKKKN